MEFTWSNRMSVGNATLDAEHREILKLVDEVERAIKTRDATRFSRALHQLELATHQHFSNEARIAQAINYRFDHHHLEHQYILKEMQIIKAELASLRGKWSESIAEHYFHFLSTWAVEHIDQDDMQMKSLLETYPYNFKPDSPPV